MPRHKFTPLQLLPSQSPCSNASQLIQPLVLWHLAASGGSTPPQRDVFLRHAICFQIVKFSINQICNLIYLFQQTYQKHMIVRLLVQKV